MAAELKVRVVSAALGQGCGSRFRARVPERAPGASWSETPHPFLRWLKVVMPDVSTRGFEAVTNAGPARNGPCAGAFDSMPARPRPTLPRRAPVRMRCAGFRVHRLKIPPQAPLATRRGLVCVGGGSAVGRPARRTCRGDHLVFASRMEARQGRVAGSPGARRAASQRGLPQRGQGQVPLKRPARTDRSHPHTHPRVGSGRWVPIRPVSWLAAAAACRSPAQACLPRSSPSPAWRSSPGCRAGPPSPGDPTARWRFAR